MSPCIAIPLVGVSSRNICECELIFLELTSISCRWLLQYRALGEKMPIVTPVFAEPMS
jgi:hypothetical protein